MTTSGLPGRAPARRAGAALHQPWRPQHELPAAGAAVLLQLGADIVYAGLTATGSDSVGLIDIGRRIDWVSLGVGSVLLFLLVVARHVRAGGAGRGGGDPGPDAPGDAPGRDPLHRGRPVGRRADPGGAHRRCRRRPLPGQGTGPEPRRGHAAKVAVGWRPFPQL